MSSTSDIPETEVPPEPPLGDNPVKDDSFLALLILVGVLIFVSFMAYQYWKRNKAKLIDGGTIWKHQNFSPPPERAEYIEAKEKYSGLVAEGKSCYQELEDLKKVLMKRAIKSIPILLSLQNEGSSIERLYKRGMLTDDMHFKVIQLKSFVDKEFQDIQNEAEELLEGWGQTVWQQAMQFHQIIQKQQKTKDDELKSVGEESKKKKKSKKESTKVEDTKTPEAEKIKKAKVIDVLDKEESKIKEAERMMKKLIEEEEKEKKKKGGTPGSGKKNAKK